MTVVHMITENSLGSRLPFFDYTSCVLLTCTLF